MPRRKPTDIAAVGLRLREPLRAALQKAAEQRGVSLNAELVERLERSLTEEADFGGPEIRNMARLMAAAFLRGGQAGARSRQHSEWDPSKWMEDSWCYTVAVAAVGDALNAAQPVQLKFKEGVSPKQRATADKIFDRFAQLTARGYDIKMTGKDDENG